MALPAGLITIGVRGGRGGWGLVISPCPIPALRSRQGGSAICPGLSGTLRQGTR